MPSYRATSGGNPQDLFVRLGVPLPGLDLLVRTGTGIPVWAFAAGVGQGFEHWLRLRRLHERTGLYPFLLGPEDAVDDLTYMAQHDCDPTAVERGRRMDGGRRLAELRVRNDVAHPREVFDSPDPDVQPTPEPHFTTDGKETLVALVPAAAGYEVPGLLSWQGAANWDLDGADHVAIVRRWHDLYGAEVVTLAFDMLELLVPRPPVDPMEAATVAVDQYAYCPPAVDQGVGNLPALAAGQVRSPSWYFWWD